MTVNSLLTDLTVMSLFLIIGFLVREVVKPLQKLFLPASIIGGIIALILGPQVLGLAAIPKSFSAYSGALIRFVMCALIFGVSMNRQKLKSYGDYMMVVHSVYGMQMFVGIALGSFFCAIWNGLPTGWGFQAVQAFYGGHGTVSAAGSVFEGITGSQDATAIGLVMATFGLIVAMTVGMLVVNIGVRRGWATYIKEVAKQPPHYYGGVLPKEEQKSIGSIKTTGISVNALALQLAWVLLSMYIGERILDLLKIAWPGAGKINLLAWDTLGGLVGFALISFVKLDRFVDKKTVNQLAGTALEILLVGAMATLDLKVLGTFIVPIVLMTVIVSIITIAWALFMCKKTCTEEWFEKALMIVGQSTGNTPTGLALVRAVDPDSLACPPEAHGIYSGLTFWTSFFTALLPISLAAGNMKIGIIAGLIQFVFCAGVGFFVFGRLKKKSQQQEKLV